MEIGAPTGMDDQEYLDHLVRESAVLADAAAAAGPDAPVPGCPGWTVTDLLRHCTAGDAWARQIVATGSREGAATELPDDAPTGAGLVAYFRAGADALAAVLAAADPGGSVWTFSAADRTARFWIRRRAHETTVHRVDAEAAAGRVTSIEPRFAADGIDEFLTVFVPRFGPGLAALGGTVHLHCTDVEGEWLLVPAGEGGEGVTVTREHAKGDVAARGRAEDLLLHLWGRRPADTLEVFGDDALLARFVAAVPV
jgi:uncharacterized protein (TIGR03083 family)